jgi:hypothetical protein
VPDLLDTSEKSWGDGDGPESHGMNLRGRSRASTRDAYADQARYENLYGAE